MDDVDRLALAAARETMQDEIDPDDEESCRAFIAAKQVLAILRDGDDTSKSSGS